MTVESKFVDCSVSNPSDSKEVKMTLDKTNGYVNEVSRDFKVSGTAGFKAEVSGELPGVFSASAEFSLSVTMEQGVPVTLLNQNSSCCVVGAMMVKCCAALIGTLRTRMSPESDVLLISL
jgi:hypothetical protein